MNKIKKPNRQTVSTLLILFCVLFSGTVFGQQVIDRIMLGNTAVINSLKLDESRNVYVYLPLGYEQSATKYPVIYLLDGDFHYHHGSGIVQFLSTLNRMPRSIVVAIPNTNRNRDFTPTVDERRTVSGGADKFLDFMEKQLIPFIDKSYRTQKHRILFGHSLTAMFTVYTLASRPNLFNAYIAASPYLQFDNQFVIKKFETFLENNESLNKTLYMTIGAEPAYEESLNKMTNLLEAHPSSGIEWKYMQMESENHGSVPHKTIYDGLEFIYTDWQLTADKTNNLAAIEAHYKHINEKYGYKILITEATLNQIGYRVMGNGDMESAIQIFIRNVEKYPASANVYDSLGEAYEQNEQLNLAVKSYNKAVEIGKKIKDPNQAIYEEHLFNARMKQKVVKE